MFLFLSKREKYEQKQSFVEKMNFGFSNVR